MARLEIQKWSGVDTRTGSLQIDLKAGSIACCEGQYQSSTVAVEDAVAENKPEVFQVPGGVRIRRFDNEWEHWIKTNNPDNFPAPASSFNVSVTRDVGDAMLPDFGAIFPRLLGTWNTFWGLTAIGKSGINYNTLDTGNYDINETATSANVYLWGTPPGTGTTGPGGFVPPDQGVANIGGERVHYGNLASPGSSIGTMARMFGLPGIGPYGWGPWWGFVHYGHDYVTNPLPPPPTLLSRSHDGVSIWYPPRWLNFWMASSFWSESYFPAPVGYTPKGAKCGTFMPMILRFLITRRKNKSVNITAGAKP